MFRLTQKQLLEYAFAASKISSGPVRTVDLHIASNVSIGTFVHTHMYPLLLVTMLTPSPGVLLGNSHLDRPVHNPRKRKRSSMYSERSFLYPSTSGYSCRFPNVPRRHFSSSPSVARAQLVQREQRAPKLVVTRQQASNAPEPMYRGTSIDESKSRPHSQPSLRSTF